jgi:hypothetical protein
MQSQYQRRRQEGRPKDRTQIKIAKQFRIAADEPEI